jgi:hypothetical protein
MAEPIISDLAHRTRFSVLNKKINKIKGMNPRASSGLKRKLVSLAPLTPQQSCEEYFD